MKKVLTSIMAVVLLGTTAFAQSAPTVKPYGFVRSYFAFDTRESSAGTEDLYYYMPKDRNMVDGEDLNAIPSLRFAALTSRVGLNITGYEYEGYKMAGKIETDFYCGVSGVSGTAQLRLRQAFVTVEKEDRFWKIGQAWHPMAADLPDIFSLEVGVPFGAFSRTPQVAFEKKVNDSDSFTAVALWQMQYNCTGPKGASADYIKYGCTPEIYLGWNSKGDHSLTRFGVDVLSIKPRNYGWDLTDPANPVQHKVSDRRTSFSIFGYGEYKGDNWIMKDKCTYSTDGSHLNMLGGYGVSEIKEDGSWKYTCTTTISDWFTFKYTGWDKWVPSLFIGYIYNFGTSKDVLTDAEVAASSNGDVVSAFWEKNSCSKINQMYRIQPEILYNIGKLQLGFEYMLTAVQYGAPNARKSADTDLHWIYNNRLQMLVKFNF